MGYREDAIKGVSWIAVLRLSTRVLAFIKTIILARILVPQQFGAYGVAILVLGFLEVMTETGVNVILVQEDEEDKYIDSAWIISIIRGTIIALIIIILVPHIVSFFNSPESTKLLYVISIVPFLRGFINPSVVKFQKNLMFYKEFYYRGSVFLIDTIFAVIFTFLIKDPIGIVIGLIAGVVWEVFLSYVVVKPTPIFKFNGNYINKLFHRGKWLTASGLFNYLFHNTDNIVVGRALGTSSLGVYQAAYTISILPITEISEVFSRVTFPVFTKISADKVRLRKAFFKTMGVVILLATPFGVVFFLFSEEIVNLTLGDKWISAASILPILGIFGVIRAVSGSCSSLFLAVGKQKYVTIVTLASLVGLLIPVIPLVLNYGILGAAFSALIGSLVSIPFYAYFTLKVFKSNLRSNP